MTKREIAARLTVVEGQLYQLLAIVRHLQKDLVEDVEDENG